jgi:hypothetical protein
MHLVVGEESGLRFNPLHFVIESDFTQHFPRVKIGHECHVIVTVPGTVADLPRISQTAKILATFEQCDFMPLLRQTQRESHAKDATAEDCEMLCHGESFQ